jgi:hypothetical protein
MKKSGNGPSVIVIMGRLITGGWPLVTLRNEKLAPEGNSIGAPSIEKNRDGTIMHADSLANLDCVGDEFDRSDQ